MGAEWPAGAALAMESWPARSRGLMSGLLQGAWGLGFLLASLVYWLLFELIGWRGMMWIGIAPAFLCIYIRMFVKESEVWEESNQKRLDAEQVSRDAGTHASLSATVALVIGWLVGATAVAVALFFFLKSVGPTALGGIVDAK